MSPKKTLVTFLVAAIVLAFAATVASAQSSEGWLPPISSVPEPNCGAPFGQYNSAGRQQAHTGIDYCVSPGTPIRATAGGKVVWSGWWPPEHAARGTGHGLTVWLSHGQTADGCDLHSVYAHASDLLVNVGDSVDQGQTIALVGATGAVGRTAAGPSNHLHLGVACKGPESVGWTIGQDWLDPGDFVGSAVEVEPARDWLSSTLFWLLVALVALVVLIGVIELGRRPATLGKALLVVADNAPTLLFAIRQGLREALEWWAVVLVTIVVLSPELSAIVRNGLTVWLKGQTTMPNQHLAVVFIVLVANWLFRIAWKTRMAKRQSQGKKKLGCVPQLLLLTTLIVAGAYLGVNWLQSQPAAIKITSANPRLPLPQGEGQAIEVKVSWYWPPLGGTNCYDFRNGYCHSPMRSGERWEEWVDVAIACPPEWPHHSQVVIDGRQWVCLDTGGAIKYGHDGIPWIDMLTQEPLYPFGSVVDATLYLKEE